MYASLYKCMVLLLRFAYVGAMEQDSQQEGVDDPISPNLTYSMQTDSTAGPSCPRTIRHTTCRIFPTTQIDPSAVMGISYGRLHDPQLARSCEFCSATTLYRYAWNAANGICVCMMVCPECIKHLSTHTLGRYISYFRENGRLLQGVHTGTPCDACRFAWAQEINVRCGFCEVSLCSETCRDLHVLQNHWANSWLPIEPGLSADVEHARQQRTWDEPTLHNLAEREVLEVTSPGGRIVRAYCNYCASEYDHMAMDFVCMLCVIIHHFCSQQCHDDHVAEEHQQSSNDDDIEECSLDYDGHDSQPH